jgi:hypothetical protein
MKTALDEVSTKAGKIDILVNNAGVSSYTPAIEAPVQEIRDLMGNYNMIAWYSSLIVYCRNQLFWDDSINASSGLSLYDAGTCWEGGANIK